jgi:hypothetical protein
MITQQNFYEFDILQGCFLQYTLKVVSHSNFQLSCVSKVEHHSYVVMLFITYYFDMSKVVITTVLLTPGMNFFVHFGIFMTRLYIIHMLHYNMLFVVHQSVHHIWICGFTLNQMVLM